MEIMNSMESERALWHTEHVLSPSIIIVDIHHHLHFSMQV